VRVQQVIVLGAPFCCWGYPQQCCAIASDLAMIALPCHGSRQP
jgi:hypothetical protein